MFDHERMLDLATAAAVSPGRAADLAGGTGLSTHSGRAGAPPLAVSPALRALLPGGLRRGSTVSVAGAVSFLLALLGAASAEGAWCALVGLPSISAESARERGIDL